MFILSALDVALAFQGVEPIQRGLIRSDLAAKLHFPDERRNALLLEVMPNKLEDRLLFLSKGGLGQTGLRLREKLQ